MSITPGKYGVFTLCLSAKAQHCLLTSGGKWWRLKYRFEGKEKRLSLGVYPTVSLKAARERRDEARKLLANEIDPSEHRQAMKAAKVERTANSFEVVAREWLAKHAPNWSATHSDRISRRLERDIFPWIGGRPVADITAPQLLEVIRRIEQRGALETAHRALSSCGQVFRYAVATGRAERDPSGDLRGALRLAPLVFVRPGELRKAEWADIGLEAAKWRYLVTKTRMPHIVPLSRQAVAILRELHPLTGRGRYIFPSARSAARPMSDNAILAAMRRMGIAKEEMTGHGFRAMARTILDEVLGFRPDFIEHQLAHAVRDPNGRAYNRTAHLAERRKMMQAWADYLDKLKAGADVISISQSA
jgi:integrase